MIDRIPTQGWRAKAYHASRSQRFLWKFAIGMLVLGFGVGYLVSRVIRPEAYKLGQRVLAGSGRDIDLDIEDRSPPVVAQPGATLPMQQIAPVLSALLGQPDVTYPHLLTAIPLLAVHVDPSEDEALRQIFSRRFSASETDLALAYLGAWRPQDRAAYARLQALAESPDAPRWASYALGRVEFHRQAYGAAHAAFAREGRHPDARESRYRALVSLLRAKDYAAAARLENDPAYEEFFTPQVRLRLAVGQRDWPTILRLIPVTQFTNYEMGTLALTVIAGLSWALFLAHLGQWPRFLSGRAGLCFVAMALGVLSTIPTLYLVTWQDDMLNFAAGTEPITIFAYYVGGVGAREELCKLLLFAPLLPFLIRRGDDLEALIVASFVGLGFAMEENASYFMRSEGTSAAGRFLSANFFHIALTGVNGLALFRACTRGMAGLNELLFVLPLTIVVHGGYDALMSLPDFQEGGYLSMVVYVAFSVYYFNRAYQLLEPVRMTLSLTGSFVFGVSLLAAAMIVYQMANLGAAEGANVFATEWLGCGLLLVVFLRVFNEPLSE